MSRRKFSTLRELEEYWDNDLDLTDDDDPGGTIDIVELPPDRADDVSDLEDIDDNILEDTIPNDVPGSLEILGDDLVNHIVQQSVSYATQNNRHQFTLSSDCFKKFLGFLLLTGYHSLPQEQMYWSEEEDIDIGIVRKCVSKNRYIEIKRNLVKFQ
ncbi:piggyBac transposable element-derived protein 3-like [Stegodyphus dumicola]|uniref:piggyBac transposable element-derived protein 3-like n=1 Tax=Stegodyphus dumicola TaxID=202533 RepID=UPI0015AC6AB3|nr:piggyBac transposable element-derived protein 3-like [Stegodyphus dumicola]